MSELIKKSEHVVGEAKGQISIFERPSKITSLALIDVNLEMQARIAELEQQLKQQWVSVKDRLPNDGTLVVAAHIYEYTADIDAAVCWFLHGKFHMHEDGIEASNHDGGATISLDMDITHWMPLPKTTNKIRVIK
jgi:hypothetical protein